MAKIKKNNYVALVIEDERPLLEAIRMKLEKNGFDVVGARKVEEAFNHMKDVEKIDAVWLDHYLLGSENGLDFLARIKQEDSKWKNVPIFVVSNTASEDKVKSYLALGVNKYYTKSNHSLDKIIEDINDCLKRENC